MVHCLSAPCYTAGQAEEITLTIGQAFDLAYRRFLDSQGKDLETRKQLVLSQRKAQVAEAEMVELRTRLRELAALVPSGELDKYLSQKQARNLSFIYHHFCS